MRILPILLVGLALASTAQADSWLYPSRNSPPPAPLVDLVGAIGGHAESSPAQAG